MYDSNRKIFPPTFSAWYTRRLKPKSVGKCFSAKWLLKRIVAYEKE